MNATKNVSPLQTPEPGTFAEYQQRKHLGSLDGLRAFGTTIVVYQHTVGGLGGLGANLFLLISGFIVTTLLMREQTRTGTIDTSRFSGRRVRRLCPLYFSVLCCYTLLTLFLLQPSESRTTFFHNLPAFATFSSNLFVRHSDHTIFYFAWALAAQEQFHFVWSRFMLRVEGPVRFATLLPLLCLIYFFRSDWFTSAVDTESFVYMLLMSVKPTLVMGVLLALLMGTKRGFTIIRGILGFRWIPITAIVGLVLSWRYHWLPESALHVVMFGLISSCVIREDHSLSRILKWKPVAFIGRVSFGIYLMHMLCYHMVSAGFNALEIDSVVLTFVVTLAVAIAVAAVSHFYFEPLFYGERVKSKQVSEEPAKQPKNDYFFLDPIYEAGTNVLSGVHRAASICGETLTTLSGVHQAPPLSGIRPAG